MALGSAVATQVYHKSNNSSSMNPRPIAPANSVLRSYNSVAPYGKKSSNCGTTLDSNNPSVVRRNARERNRVKQVNNGFTHLRQHIPTAIIADLSNGRRGIGPGANKKLSKVDTLRMAVEYIRRLQSVIEEVDSASETSSMRSASSTSGSPPPSAMQQAASPAYYGSDNGSNYYNSLSYAGSFPQMSHYQQQMQQQQQLISPTGSTSSSVYSNDSYYHNSPTALSASASTMSQAQTLSSGIQLKYEPISYDDYAETNNTSYNEDEEILDYISLWQEDM